MEVKVITPHISAAPDSPKSDPNNNKQESRGMRIIQYLTRTVSGNDLKDPNSHRETRSHDASDSEESDEDVHMHAPANQNSSDVVRLSLPQKLSHRLAKTESFRVEEEKGEGGLGMSKSVIEVSKGVAADLKGSFGRLLEMKTMLIEKLASMPTVPAETLEHARHSIESIISDATHSAYGKARDAMARIRVKLVEIIPSLSPHETKKIVDDVEQVVLDMSGPTNGDGSQPKKTNDQVKNGREGVSASTTSAVISPQPTSVLASNVDRLRAWALLRSRL